MHALMLAFALTTGVVQTTLVDQSGHTFSLNDLRGTPLVVTFVATHCTDTCPLVNAQFARASEDLRARHIHARLLTITLDPEHDRVADMQRIARTFSADRSNWLLASGPVAHVRSIMRAFDVVAEQGKHGYADVHSTYVYLVDRRGRPYRTELASTNLAQQIVSDVVSSWRALTA